MKLVVSTCLTSGSSSDQKWMDHQSRHQRIARQPEPQLNPPEQPIASIDPELVEQVLDMMERRWIDEEVPALGGITPHQAAVDPTRREDLIALLRSFDQMPASGGITMRPDVLRRHLGLEE